MPAASRNVGVLRVELNEEFIERLCQQIRIGVPLKYAAMSCGIHESCVQHWIRELESGHGYTSKKKLSEEKLALRVLLVNSIEKARGDFVASNCANISKQTSTDWKAASWMLSHAPETREQFSEAGRVRIETEKRLDVITDVLQRELSDADFERVLAAITESVAQAEAA